MRGKTPLRRCIWCRAQRPRVVIVEGSLSATTRDPVYWERLLLEGWKIESTRVFKDHVEISFTLLLSKKQAKTAFEDFIDHPVIAPLHHEDVMNDL